MTASSINFQPVHSAFHAVSHCDRSVSPSYLLPPDKSFGTMVLLDDKGTVKATLDSKLALASRQAKREKNYSPVWEGILNLRRPDKNEDPQLYRDDCARITNSWCERYEAMTGHRVLRVDVHLDEGHIVDGDALLNAHAHIIADRTNELGRVIKLSPKQLRDLQTATAEVTELDRGKSSKETGRKHISHHQYKALAKAGNLEIQQLKDQLKEALNDNITLMQSMEYVNKNNEEKISAKDAEIAQYKADREALKASGTATQKDYQALKAAHEQALAVLKATKAEAEKVPELIKTCNRQSQLIAEYRAERAALKASGEATQKDYKDLKAKHEQALKNAAKAFDDLKAKAIAIITPLETEVKTMTTKNAELAAEAQKWKAKAEHYEAEKAKGTPAHLIDTTPVGLDIKSRFAEMAAQARAQRANPPTPSTRGGETAAAPSEKAKQPIPQRFATSGLRPDTPESLKTPAAPIFSPSLSGSVLKPQKTLTELLKESYQAFVEWIKGEGGKVEQLQDGKNYCGKVVQSDDYFAVQSVGMGKFAIHELDKLDVDPDLDNPKTEIRYRGGFGKVLGNAPLEPDYDVPGGRGGR